MSNDGLSLHQIYHRYCHLLPPGIDSITSFLVNLPIIIFFIITFPIRYFICLFITEAKVSGLCILYNIFPFISIVCPFLSKVSQSQYCYGSCSGCKTQIQHCIGSKKTIEYMCNVCAKKYQSVLNAIFCTMGDIVGLMIYPIILLINALITPLTGKSLCFEVIKCSE